GGRLGASAGLHADRSELKCHPHRGERLLRAPRLRGREDPERVPKNAHGESLIVSSRLLVTTIMLACSNVFMTFAWYAHLRNLSARPWYVAVIVSWGIAFF